MLTYDLDNKNKYYSLYTRIRDDILSGKLRSGERLPSKRAMAENLSVSVITVQTAYDQLYAEGYIRTEERRGYFVEEVNAVFYGRRAANAESEEAEDKFEYDFVGGSVPVGLFPFSAWSRLMRGVLSGCGKHLLERVPCAGDWELKNAISNYLYRARAIDADPRRIVVGAGAEYLYGVIVQLLGRDKIFAIENPVYGKIHSTYILNGAKCECITVNATGISVGEVEKSSADIVHFSPSHQFPTGAVTPVSERLRLIKWAEKRDGYIIEDDYDSEFRLTGKPLQCAYTLCPDRVIYMNTFTKSLAPSMRIGYMVLPPKLYRKYRSIFSSFACTVPLFEQKTLAAMLVGGFFERHVSRLKKHFACVRQAIYKKAETLPFPFEITDTGSGPHLLMRFPDAKSDEALKEYAKKRGINLSCLSDYLLSPAPVPDKTAVINYSGVTEGMIENLKL